MTKQNKVDRRRFLTTAGVTVAKKGCTPRELNVAKIQDVLRADGVDLDRGGQTQDSLDNRG